MSYDSKIEKTQSIISNHNKTAKKSIDYDKFLANLQEAGGTTDEALKCCTWEDLEKFGLPTLLAKQVATVFRTKDEPIRRVITEARAQSMSTRELLEQYDSRNHTNFVGKRLSELSKGQPCLVYCEDGTINLDISSKLINEICDGFPPREIVTVDDKPSKVYAIGERPDQFAFENPLYPGTLLRSDETCDHTMRSWSSVSDVVRALIYLAVKETREIRVNNTDVAHAILDTATSVDAEKRLRLRYPKASILYEDLKKQGRLPSLRLSRIRNANDPFYTNNKRF